MSLKTSQYEEINFQTVKDLGPFALTRMIRNIHMKDVEFLASCIMKSKRVQNI